MKHWSELAILGLMLYILQSRFANGGGGDDSSLPQQTAAAGGTIAGGGKNGNNFGYQAVPDADPGGDDADEAFRPTLSV